MSPQPVLGSESVWDLSAHLSHGLENFKIKMF